jgi:hypothetical protein
MKRIALILILMIISIVGYSEKRIPAKYIGEYVKIVSPNNDYWEYSTKNGVQFAYIKKTKQFVYYKDGRTLKINHLNINQVIKQNCIIYINGKKIKGK